MVAVLELNPPLGVPDNHPSRRVIEQARGRQIMRATTDALHHGRRAAAYGAPVDDHFEHAAVSYACPRAESERKLRRVTVVPAVPIRTIMTMAPVPADFTMSNTQRYWPFALKSPAATTQLLPVR